MTELGTRSGRTQATWRHVLLALVSLALVLGSIGPGMVRATMAAHHGADPVAEERAHADGRHAHDAPCHHGADAGATTASDDHPHGDGHETGGCCATILCGGLCSAACGGSGANAEAAPLQVPEGPRAVARARSLPDAPVPSRALDTPFRPPIG